LLELSVHRGKEVEAGRYFSLFLSVPSLNEWEFHSACHADASTPAKRTVSHQKSQVDFARTQDSGCIEFAGDLDVVDFGDVLLKKASDVFDAHMQS